MQGKRLECQPIELDALPVVLAALGDAAQAAAALAAGVVGTPR
jgi:hypothetical protein